MLTRLPGANSNVFLCLFTAVINTSVGIASASFILVFLVSNEIAKMFLKTIGKKKISI